MHAVPLTLVAGTGHWALGSVDWQLMAVLLMGSLPGIMVGSYSALRVPETVLRVTLATVLILVAGKIGYQQLHVPSSTVTAHRAIGHRRSRPSRSPRATSLPKLPRPIGTARH